MSFVQPLPPKKDVALALLERSSVHIHLDPRVSSVIVPSWFKNQPQLVLQIGLNMPVPINDLRLDDDGLSCTLSFNRAAFHCVVPWTSVFAMVGDDGRGMVWPEDLPPEVARQAQARAPQHAPSLVPSVPQGPAEAATDKEARASQAEPDSSAPTPRRKKKADLREAPQNAGVADASKTDASKTGAEAESAEDPKSKKPRKKPRIVPNPEAENRARLVAVPAPAVSDPRPPRAEPRSPQAASRPQPPGAGTPRGGKKRELPPYLRVVK
jgi:stringent starvation protein B